MAERLEPASLREYENCIKLLRDSDAYICCWPWKNFYLINRYQVLNQNCFTRAYMEIKLVSKNGVVAYRGTKNIESNDVKQSCNFI